MHVRSKRRRQARASDSVRSRPGSEVGARVTAGPEPSKQVSHRRINTGLLATPERNVLRWLAERTPAWVKPDHLTGVGLGGALLTMIGLIACHVSRWFVTAAIVGLFMNWYGDSLDGTLARYRQIERPHYGYFIDHSCDLISQTLIFVGLGLSPYLTLRSALLALSMYLLMSCYTYLKVLIFRQHQLSYGGMGATEMRLAIGCWALLAIRVGPGLVGTTYMNYPVIDEVIGGLWGLTFIGFLWIVRSDLRKFRAIFESSTRDETSKSASDAQEAALRRI